MTPGLGLWEVGTIYRKPFEPKQLDSLGRRQAILRDEAGEVRGWTLIPPNALPVIRHKRQYFWFFNDAKNGDAIYCAARGRA